MNAPLPPVDRYVYLLGDLPFLILWLGVYCCRKDLRRPLWIMSLFTTAGSLTGPFFREDYFHPRRIWDLDGLGLEDVIFCFTVGGLLFAVNKVLAGWHLHHGPRPRSALRLLPLPFCYTAAFLLLIQLVSCHA